MKFAVLITTLLSLAIASERAEPFNNPSHVYTHEEVSEVFTPILTDSVQSKFEEWLTVLFDPDFPKPIHPNSSIVQCWNCLYNQMLNAQQSGEEQLSNLYMLLTHHKNAIKKFAPELYKGVESHFKY